MTQRSLLRKASDRVSTSTVECQGGSSIPPYKVRIEEKNKLSCDEQAQINFSCTRPIIISPCQQLAKYVWDDPPYQSCIFFNIIQKFEGLWGLQTHVT